MGHLVVILMFDCSKRVLVKQTVVCVCVCVCVNYLAAATASSSSSLSTSESGAMQCAPAEV